MGFKRTKTYALRWADDTDFAGLEVETRPLPLGTMEQFGPFMALKGSNREDFTAAELDRILGLFWQFGDEALISWNYEVEQPDPDDPTKTVDVPVPPTGAGMRSVDLEMGLAVVLEWIEAVTDVTSNADGDLGKDSPPGGTSPEVSIPMEPLSPDLPSSMTPS